MSRTSTTKFESCPVGDLKQALRESFDFYGTPTSDEKPSAERKWTPWHPVPLDRDVANAIENGTKIDFFDHWGEKWQRMNPPHLDWQPGPQHRDPMATSFNSGYPFACHFHCDYELANQSVHIDYLADLGTGPSVGVYEYRFYVDGSLRSRGGYRVRTFTAVANGKPPAIRVGNYLLIATRYLHGSKLPIQDAISLWHCDEPFKARFSRFTGRFANSSIDDVVSSLNHVCGLSGWGTAKGEWYSELINELERRGIDCCQFGRADDSNDARWVVRDGHLIHDR